MGVVTTLLVTVGITFGSALGSAVVVMAWAWARKLNALVDLELTQRQAELDRMAKARAAKRTKDRLGGVPPWLVGVAEGAGLDVEKLATGDADEMARAKTLLEGLKSQGAQQQQLLG